MKYLPNLSRYDEFNAEAALAPVYPEGVLLYGSSFFTNWGREKAHEQMLAASGGRLNVTNRGFGGATADELLYFYNDLVRPCRPKLILWRGGANDYFRGLTVHDAWEISMRCFEWAKKDFPGVKIVILCVFEHPSCVKEEQRAFYKAYDALAKEYARDNENVYFLDMNDFFHVSPEDVGSFENFRDIFISDGLHLRQEVYEEYAAYLAPKLTKILDET